MMDYHQIEIQKLAVSTTEDRYLLVCNGQYYEANHSIVELLQTLRAHEEEKEGIASYILLKNNRYTVEQVEIIIANYIRPLLQKEVSPQKRKTFLYEKELLTAMSIDKFSNLFSFLFNKKYMVTVLVTTLMLDLYFLIYTEELLKFNNHVNVYSVLGLLIFMLTSSLFHEIGHASACKHFGLKHGGIGFGLYLNFPVLYTDVTEVWKLNRKQRCVVNIAGVYFQCYCLLALLTAFLLTNNDLLRYLILTMNLGFIITLNPFFKFDGYWIASDLLGVPNLRKRSMELIRYLLNRFKGNTEVAKPYLFQIRKAEQYCLLFYSVLVNLFMGYYFCYIIPQFLYKFMQSFPDEVKQLVTYLSNNLTPPFALLRNIGMQLLFLILLCYMLTYTVIRPLKKYVQKKKMFRK